MATAVSDGEFEMETLGESDREYELEGEFQGEDEFEDEFELGGVSQGEYEAEDEYEYESEYEGEYEGEPFFGSIGRFVRKNLPSIKKLAKIAAPLVASAVGGPLGGLIATGATSALGESEYEFEGEWSSEYEDPSHETEAEASAAPSQSEAEAELMASVASRSAIDAEAEALIGAAVLGTLSAHDRRVLRRSLPHLIRAMAVLTRMLRRRPSTRPMVRTIPSIVRRSARALNAQAAAGQPLGRRAVANTLALQTSRVLGNPRACGVALQKNLSGARASHRLASQSPRWRSMAAPGGR
jgi:hypothetical protein